MTEDTVLRLMGLADEYAQWRTALVAEGGSSVRTGDARSTLESAIREALQPAGRQGEVQGLTDAEIQRLRAENPVLRACIESLKSDLAERDAEIERLRVDARRYHTIRDRVSGRRDPAGSQGFALPAIRPVAGADIMRGSVAQHFDAALDQMKDTP